MGINPLFPGLPGAGFYPPSRPENQTQEYLQLIKRAGGDDDKLSKQELQDEISKLNQQKTLINQVIETFGDFFGGQAKVLFTAIKKQIDVRLTVANRVNDNFLKFDEADEKDDAVNRDDVIALAKKDGNVYDISNRDLGIPVETPKDIRYYFQFFQGADKEGGFFPGQGDGKLTVDEINDHVETLQERIEKLEELRDLYPPTWQAAINNQIDELQRQVNAGNRMKTNFDSLDAANKDNKTDGKLTYKELYDAANRDKDPSDLSDQDLVRPPTT